MSAIKAWKARLEASDDQWERAKSRRAGASEDHWEGHGHHFKVDPRRTGDPILERLAREVTPSTSVLDVGGGAGRYGLPLALMARHVTVVEPSDSMIDGLRDGMKESGIDNVTAVHADWDDANVEPADVVLSADVIHHVVNVDTFVQRLSAYATGKVLVLEHVSSPSSWVASFWEPVHGEEWIEPPGLPELMNVLWEMDIYPDLEMLTTSELEATADMEEALKDLRHFLFVDPGTEADERLLAAADKLLVTNAEGVTIAGARPMRQVLLSWRPGEG